jgi:membrane protease YdiL (CAAX protease family)
MVYLALTAAGFATLVLAMVELGIRSEWLLLTTIPISGMLAFWLTGARVASRDRSSYVTATVAARWTFCWLLLALICLHLASVVNDFGPSILLFIVTSALGEELVFRRLPVALQHRAALLDSRQTALFAAATTTAFVVIHGSSPVLPTLEKVMFGVCAYYACLATRSVLLPLALHVMGNAAAAAWVSQSGTNALAWFSVSSMGASAIAVLGLRDANGFTQRVRRFKNQ